MWPCIPESAARTVTMRRTDWLPCYRPSTGRPMTSAIRATIRHGASSVTAKSGPVPSAGRAAAFFKALKPGKHDTERLRYVLPVHWCGRSAVQAMKWADLDRRRLLANPPGIAKRGSGHSRQPRGCRDSEPATRNGPDRGLVFRPEQNGPRGQLRQYGRVIKAAGLGVRPRPAADYGDWPLLVTSRR